MILEMIDSSTKRTGGGGLWITGSMGMRESARVVSVAVGEVVSSPVLSLSDPKELLGLVVDLGILLIFAVAGRESILLTCSLQLDDFALMMSFLNSSKYSDIRCWDFRRRALRWRILTAFRLVEISKFHHGTEDFLILVMMGHALSKASIMILERKSVRSLRRD